MPFCRFRWITPTAKTYEDASITDPAEREKHFRQKDHYRMYGRDYLKQVKEAGFLIREQKFPGYPFCRRKEAISGSLKWNLCMDIINSKLYNHDMSIIIHI